MQLARLGTQQSNLIDLAAESASAKQKVRQKLRAIERERERIRARLDGVDTEIKGGVELLEVALSCWNGPMSCTGGATDAGRRQINQALLEKPHIYRDEIVDAELRFPFGDLVEAHERHRTGGGSVVEMKKPG